MALSKCARFARRLTLLGRVTPLKGCTRSMYSDVYEPKNFIHLENTVGSSRPRTKAGGHHTITLVPGVGLGPELCDCLVDVFACSGAPIAFELIENAHETELDFRNMIYSVQRNGVAIKGDIEKMDKHKVWKDEIPPPSRNWLTRRLLDLYVSVAECKSLPIVSRRMKTDFDVVVIRQNTEGVFAMLEHAPVSGLVENLSLCTKYNSARVAEFAFDYVQKKKRSKITVLHRAAVMPLLEGMFLKAFKVTAERYPGVYLEMMDVSGGFKKFLANPKSLDVVVSNSLHAGTFSSMVFGAMGSKGLVCGQNIGEKYRVFEPAARGQGWTLVGKNMANPTAYFMCGVAALDNLGHKVHADIIRLAILKTLGEDKVYTVDMGGKASTKDFTMNVIQRVREMAGNVLCRFDPKPEPLIVTERKKKQHKSNQRPPGK